MDKQAAYELGARLALQEDDVPEEYYPHTKQAAYDLGTRLAMQQAGLLNEEKPVGKTASVRDILARMK